MIKTRRSGFYSNYKKEREHKKNIEEFSITKVAGDITRARDERNYFRRESAWNLVQETVAKRTESQIKKLLDSGFDCEQIINKLNNDVNLKNRIIISTKTNVNLVIRAAQNSQNEEKKIRLTDITDGMINTGYEEYVAKIDALAIAKIKNGMNKEGTVSQQENPEKLDKNR